MDTIAPPPDLRRFGLHTWPFGSAMPAGACTLTTSMERFVARLPLLVGQGGFALVTGDVGTGKSTLLRIIQARLCATRDMQVRVLSRPQASLADFYRELGALFELELRPHNRWRSTQALREQWTTHWEAVASRPVILVDEAQEASVKVLGELRLLATGMLDQHILATVILAGDRRLLQLLATPELAPLLSRIGARCRLDPRSPEELRELLGALLEGAGNAGLMTEAVIDACCQHAQGNCRTLMHLASELLEAACANPHCSIIDDGLFQQVIGAAMTPVAGPAGRTRRRR